MEESVLLATKSLVDSMRRFIRDPSGVFFYVTPANVVSLNDVTIPPSPVLNELENHRVIVMIQAKVRFFSVKSVKLHLPLEHKIHIFSPPCDILYTVDFAQKKPASKGRMT